jgi:glycogen debranching enzyme
LHTGETPLELLGLDQSAHFAAQFFLTPRVQPDEEAPCSIMRRRLIDHVWIEEISVTNHRHESSEMRVVLEIDTDFADLFEVKDGTVTEREVSCHHDDRTLTLAYVRAGFRRSISISASRPATVTREGFTFSLQLAPSERWSTTFTITPHASQSGIAFAKRESRGGLEELSIAKSAELEEWLARAPVLRTQDTS